MDFGKLISGKLYAAPNILNKNGKQYINPPEELYREYGYFPIEYTVIPDILVGYHVVCDYELVGDKIIQRWNYEADEATLSARIRELEEKINELTFNLKQVTDGIIEIDKKEDTDMPAGDYLNPIPYARGTFVKIGLFYTDGENIWEAIADGTPSSFADKAFFDIIG